jgi:hypothetical protein
MMTLPQTLRNRSYVTTLFRAATVAFLVCQRNRTKILDCFSVRRSLMAPDSEESMPDYSHLPPGVHGRKNEHVWHDSSPLFDD